MQQKTREETGKGNQTTALRFQTGGKQTSPASLRGKCLGGSDNKTSFCLTSHHSALRHFKIHAAGFNWWFRRLLHHRNLQCEMFSCWNQWVFLDQVKLCVQLKPQALIYDILTPTTAIVDYAIGLEKLANKVFQLCSNVSKFVTDN